MKAYTPLIEAYGKQAGTYDRRWNRFSGDAILEAAIDAVPWSHVRRILDVGCGTGLLERSLNGQLHPEAKITGVDLSLAMLIQARDEILRNHGNHSNGLGQHPSHDLTRTTQWSNALAEHLPFPSASFDAVLCVNSFLHYRAPERVLQEFRRVLRPQGCLVLAGWCDDYLTCKIGHRLWRIAFPQAYGGSRCYGLDDLNPLLKKAGFRLESARKFRVDWRWGGMVHRAVPAGASEEPTAD